jgi:hypothetical protein
LHIFGLLPHAEGGLQSVLRIHRFRINSELEQALGLVEAEEQIRWLQKQGTFIGIHL